MSKRRGAALDALKRSAVLALRDGRIRADELWELALRVADGQPIEPLAEALASRPPASPSEAVGVAVPAPSPGQPRYELRGVLGRGGGGFVERVFDAATGRVVARKRLRKAPSNEEGERFLREARVAAALEHPNIVPIYDVGQDDDGPFYTMRVVNEQSLQEVLSAPGSRPRWPLSRLMSALSQVSRALAYAHRHDVIHRDIKPENILLGDEGQVYLVDWGTAKRLRSTGPAAAESSVPEATNSDDRLADEALRRASGVSGTPGYMAPEQLDGTSPIDHRADLFALGVVLYEILCGHHPFDAKTLAGVVIATRTREPRPPREHWGQCPLVLEDLCLALLRKDPNERPASAELVAHEIDAYLEGDKERTRRKAEARQLCERAKGPALQYELLGREADRLLAQARAELSKVEAYDPVEQKRPAWALIDQAAEMRRQRSLALAEAVELLTKALGYDPRYENARAELADLYWAQALIAEAERRPAEQVYYEALVAELDTGEYRKLLRARGSLVVHSRPVACRLTAARYVLEDRRLVPSEPIVLVPGEPIELDAGSYLLEASSEGRVPTRLPVKIDRGARVESSLWLPPQDDLQGGFLYVPAGTFRMGGDREAPDGLPPTEEHVEGFAISKFPVTFREYCGFLDELQASDPELARKRAPHDMRGSEGYAVRLNEDGHWEPLPTIIEGEGRKRFPIEDGHLWNVPVVLVDWFDAAAYCAYLSNKLSRAVRLPTEAEWEKSARGVDGRVFVWGDHFDPTFCHMRHSRESIPQPEPHGSFASDESVYGVRDLAGGVREWVADIHGEASWETLVSETEPMSDTERDHSSWRVVRSGAWVATEEYCRAASRTRFFALTRGTGLGFRVAYSLSSGSG